jgi:hypothetical protein
MLSIFRHKYAVRMGSLPRNLHTTENTSEVSESMQLQSWWNRTAPKWASETWTEGRGKGAAAAAHIRARRKYEKGGIESNVNNNRTVIDAAICISGQLRTFAHVIESLEQNLFSLFDSFHVFAVVTDAAEAAQVHHRLHPRLLLLRDAPGHRLSEVTMLDGSHTRITDSIGYEYMVAGREGEGEEVRLTRRRMSHSDPHLQYWLKQLEGLCLCNEMRLFHEARQGVRYRWVVRARWDTTLLAPMRRSDLRHDAIVVPEHQNHGGLNDKLAVGPPALMDAYFQQLDAVYHTPPIVRPYQAETFLQAHHIIHRYRCRYVC